MTGSMAIEEAPGNSGGVQLEEQHRRTLDVTEDLQNIRLVIDIGDDRTVEIPLKGKLILQNSGPPQAAAAAGDGEHKKAADKEKKEEEDKEFLMQMQGWLMTVGTLFVTMAFQAALQPPAWLRTTDFLRYSQSEIDQFKHLFHGASHATVAPARFAPSSSPSPQAAESATAGLSDRARAYMSFNYITFGSSLALVLRLLWKIPPHRAKHTMWAATCMMGLIALSAVATVVLGTTEDWLYILTAVFLIALYAGAAVYTVEALIIFSRWIALIKERRTGKRSPPSPDRAERTPAP